jgi:DNA-binding response OmpR family regulator
MTVTAPLREPRRRRILVVDDDPRCRQAVARLLAEEGYDAAAAADGEEASGLLTSWGPDLVVTDLEMPRLDGRRLVDTVRRVRPGTPVLVLSARRDPDTEKMAQGFFPKPVRVDSLLARIRDLVG